MVEGEEEEREREREPLGSVFSNNKPERNLISQLSGIHIQYTHTDPL